MKETKKVVLEQGAQDGYKRMTLESGIEHGPESETPKWNAMKNSIKEGTAEKVTIFGKAFMGSLGTAVITGIILAVVVLYFVCGR